MSEPLYFALFRGFIVTANPDGSIPLNAKCVAACTEIEDGLMATLLAQANKWAAAS